MNCDEQQKNYVSCCNSSHGTYDYSQEEGALDVARAVRFVRKNADVYGIDPDDIAVMGFSAGGIQAGEFLMHYDEEVNGTALDDRYEPDELDEVLAHASAAGMIYSFYGRLSVGNMDPDWLAQGNLPPTFYAAGYSAGGETMSQAVSMRPDLYAAYLHGASQWDGSYEPIAENGVAVFIYMAEGDEYYGSEKARSAYENLHAAYEEAGWSEDDIDQVLRLEIPDNAFFNAKGIFNYHGGANVVFDDPDNLNWIIEHTK